MNSNIDEAIRNTVAKTVSMDEALRGIFLEHYKVNDKQDDAGYKAYGLLAVEVAMAAANLFLAIKNPESHRTYRAICDVSYGLATNEFWRKNASILMPVIQIGLNTYRDGAELVLRRAQRDEYSSSDALISASRAAPLEIFPLIAYLLDGPVLQAEISLPIKQELSPYFLG